MARGFHLSVLVIVLPLLSLAGCAMGPRFVPESSGLAEGNRTSSVLVQGTTPGPVTDAEVLAAAREDQRSFEVLRRSRLPMASPLLSGSFACTEKIGAYCVDRLNGGFARIDLAESPDVSEARGELVATLRVVAGRLPGDPWVHGQLIRYLVERGEFAEASAVAGNCRAEPVWWCLALAGYVYHRSGFAEPAEIAFRAAVDAMPPNERVLWMDPAPLLDAEEGIALAYLDGSGASQFESIFWRLSDPLLTRPGNEIFSEHLARHVDLNLQIEAEGVEGPLEDRGALESIGRYDLLLRYGPPSGWMRGLGQMGMVDVMWVNVPYQGAIEEVQFLVRGVDSGEWEVLNRVWESRNNPGTGPGMGLLAPPRGVRDLIASYDIPPQDLLPPRGTIFRDVEGEEDDHTDEGWDSVAEVPQAAYLIPLEGSHARWIAPLAHQIAVFRRGDSATVVGGWDLAAHGVVGTGPVEAGLALLPSDDPLAPIVIARPPVSTLSGAAAATVPARPTLLSVEGAVAEERVLGRTRQRLDLSPLPPSLIAMSDLLLLQGGADPVDSLAAAIPLARGSGRVPPGEELRVYWEMYGLNPAVAPEITMSFVLRRPASGAVGGALRWLGETVGLLGEQIPLRTEWVEEVVAGPWMGRSLSFRIPDLSEGTYTLVLSATLPGREPILATREIEVTRETIGSSNSGRMFRRPELTRPTRCVPEVPITASAFSVSDPRLYMRNPLCMYSPDPSWFGHYGGSDDLRDYGYDGW